ncbi:translation initiation factor IF-1 [Patescibacteria group bacterium]|nr:translation initiation factor IF-1 [Patescibacteria group bacterium]
MAENQAQENRVSGEVVETLPSLRFRVRLDDGREILAYLAGRLIIHRIRILPGDRVTLETTPYDENKGRIVYREKKEKL